MAHCFGAGETTSPVPAFTWGMPASGHGAARPCLKRQASAAMWIRRIVLALLIIMVIGAAAFLVWAWEPAIALSERPDPASFDHETVQRGAELAAMGNCNTCHTAAGGKAFAGGQPLPTPFGTIYGTNITPDM